MAAQVYETAETVEQFARRLGVTLKHEHASRNPNMSDTDHNGRPWDADHYRVTLRRGSVAMGCYFSKGRGHKGQPPTVEEVLSCLMSDAQILDYCADVEEFAREMGYDTDSRKAMRDARATWNAIRKSTNKLRRLLGDEFERGLYEVEPL